MAHNRYISYLDILGFSEIVNRTNIDSLVDSYKHLIDGALKHSLPNVSNDKHLEYVQSARASDTILIYTTDKTDTHFKYLIKYTWSFLLYCFISHLPVRGAIDYGEFYYDKNDNIYLGKALVNVHKVAIKQDWAGVILTDECIKKIKNITKLNAVMDDFLTKNQIINYKVPMKDEYYIERLILNWAPMIINERIGNEVKPISEKEFRETFLPPWLNINPIKYNVERKIQNTYRYYLAHYQDKIPHGLYFDSSM